MSASLVQKVAGFCTTFTNKPHYQHSHTKKASTLVQRVTSFWAIQAVGFKCLIGIFLHFYAIFCC